MTFMSSPCRLDTAEERIKKLPKLKQNENKIVIMITLVTAKEQSTETLWDTTRKCSVRVYTTGSREVKRGRIAQKKCMGK